MKVAVNVLGGKEENSLSKLPLVVFASEGAASKTTKKVTKKATKKTSKKSSAKSSAVFHGVPKEMKSFLEEDDNFTAGFGETAVYRMNGFYKLSDMEGHPFIIAIGTGSSKELTTDKVRRLAVAVHGKLQSLKSKEFSVAFDTLSFYAGKNDDYARAFSEGLVMASYAFDEFKAKKAGDKAFNTVYLIVENKKTFNSVKKSCEEGVTLAEATNFSRWLGDCPGNKMTPTRLAEVTTEAAKGSKLKVTAWDEAKMKKSKMGALLGVSAGSDEPARLIVMEYKGAAASKKPVCFVGKGLTFDAGGISIKPSPGMEEMKFDMCGGANVIGAMLAIARLKLKVNAIGIVPASENLCGPSACKPGDILTAMNGTTIEVNNTDAEGRLILADALCYAKTRKPAMIVDAATLTGAMMVALGSSFTGVFCNNEKMWNKITKSAEGADEKVWRMPLDETFSKDMKGHYADLANIGPGREAGSCTAAAFLQNFIDEEIPWAHFDIAGTAWHMGKRSSYHPKKGASGVMVRTFVELARNY